MMEGSVFITLILLVSGFDPHAILPAFPHACRAACLRSGTIETTLLYKRFYGIGNIITNDANAMRLECG